MLYHDGDIFSPNRTGHELIVCTPADDRGNIDKPLSYKIQTLFPEAFEFFKHYCKQPLDENAILGKAVFYAEKCNGFDYTIAVLYAQEIIDQRKRTNHTALRDALSTVREVALPLPARALTTVRIPYGMGCDLNDELWETVCRIIQDELMEYDIPVEIWS